MFFGGDFKPNLEPLTKRLVKNSTTIQEYLEQSTEKLPEIDDFQPSEEWWNCVKSVLARIQIHIDKHFFQTKEYIDCMEKIADFWEPSDDVGQLEV